MVSILVKNALFSIQLFIQHGLRLKGFYNSGWNSF